METIFAKIAQETTKFDLGDEEVRFYRQTSENPSETDDIPYWRGLYGPLYPKSLDSIGAVKDEQYGPAERNRLDVFFPRDGKTKGKPVLARDWTFHNIAVPKYGQGSPDKIILLGQSSGRAHITVSLYAAERNLSDKSHSPLFGSDAEEVWGPLSPLGLFQSLSKGSPLLDPECLPVYSGSVKWEIKETADATATFFNAYRERSIPQGTLPTFHVQEKHNHIGNVFSIGTADSAQGDRLLEFMQSCVAKIDQRIQQRKETGQSKGPHPTHL
ncbi:hypothetical protein AFLA_007552 [Aspergillus flavus NRRL3357]|nr:hypothetical protein AFLA_007552 [Aspergillus flavus NRRL3357]